MITKTNHVASSSTSKTGPIAQPSHTPKDDKDVLLFDVENFQQSVGDSEMIFSHNIIPYLPIETQKTIFNLHNKDKEKSLLPTLTTEYKSKLLFNNIIAQAFQADKVQELSNDDKLNIFFANDPKNERLLRGKMRDVNWRLNVFNRYEIFRPFSSFLVAVGAETRPIRDPIYKQLGNAIIYGRLGEIEELIEYNNTDINSPIVSFVDGYSPLHFACAVGRVKIVEYLINVGVNINLHRFNNLPKELKDFRGKSPIMVAVERGRFEITRMLVESGANLYLEDDNGETVLHTAARRIQLSNDISIDGDYRREVAPEDKANAVDIYNFILLNSKLDENKPNRSGETPLDIKKRMRVFQTGVPIPPVISYIFRILALVIGIFERILKFFRIF